MLLYVRLAQNSKSHAQGRTDLERELLGDEAAAGRRIHWSVPEKAALTAEPPIH